MDEPRIRPATRADIDALCRLRHAMFVEMGSAIAGQEPQFLAACRAFYAQLFDQESGHVWIADGAGAEPVAALTLLFRARMPSPKALGIREGYVTGVYTAPAWRGRGLASDLMDLALAEARRRGVTRVRLSTSEAGRRVYAARGFVPRNDAMELDL